MLGVAAPDADGYCEQMLQVLIAGPQQDAKEFPPPSACGLHCLSDKLHLPKHKAATSGCWQRRLPA